MKLKIILRLTQYRFSKGERMWVPSVIAETDTSVFTLWEGDYQKTKELAYKELRRHRPIVSRHPGIVEVDLT